MIEISFLTLRHNLKTMFFRDLIASTNIITFTVAGLLILSMLIQLIYYLAVFGKIIRYKSPPRKKQKEAVKIKSPAELSSEIAFLKVRFKGGLNNK